MGGTNWDTQFNFRVVNLTDSEMWLLQARNKSGVEIALSPSSEQYFNFVVPANTAGLCMNRQYQAGTDTPVSTTATEYQYGTNYGGYAKSYGGRQLMAEYDSALPTDFKSVLSLTPAWADNAGHKNTSTSAVSKGFTGLFFLPSQMQITGTTSNINPAIANYYSQWQWFKNGNVEKVYRHNMLTYYCAYWLRDADIQSIDGFQVLRENDWGNNQTIGIVSARSFGIRACCRIAA